MSLDAGLTIATGSLANINRQLALVSQNVANASTPGYVRETATQTTLTADGIGMGVRSGPAQRSLDTVLQQGVWAQNATVAGLQTRQAALQAIDAVLGTPGQGSDLPSLLGQVQDTFTALSSSPGGQTQQRAVVGAADALAGGINALSNTYGTQRQAAQDAIVADVKSLNAALGTIGVLTQQIIDLKARGQSTADLENQRDTAVHTVSELVGVKTLEQENGNILLLTASGMGLPTRDVNPFSVGAASVGAGAYYPGGGLPGIKLGGADVTGQLTGGTLGAHIALRDTTLPTYQAELDEFAHTLAGRFDAQGLRLFSDPAGTVPSGGGVPVQASYVGFASEITVNPAVRADPSLVRDGTQAVAGSPGGASALTPNPAGGPAGFATMITRVLDFAFGTEAQRGVAQPAVATAGLGPTGTLASPYAAPASLGALAATLVGAQSQDSANATSRLGTETAVQTTLQSKLTTASGVSMDTEMASMVQLQNAYSANARIITAVQAMWNQLLNAVQ